jgi:hypothetical protein
VFENFAPRKNAGATAGESDGEAGPFKKMRITLKASKFQVADEADEKEGAEPAKA